jgi:uncharacterized membrane protein (DUF2068 family)
MHATAATAKPRPTKDRLLSLIVLFKFLKGALLIAVALGAHHLISRDVGNFAERLVDSFRVDPDNRYIHALLEKAEVLNAKQLKELSIGSFFYSAIVLTEGTGLALRKRWAEYFTIIITASFLPLEIYELVRHATGIKIVVLAINVAIVGYLIARLRRKPAGSEESTRSEPMPAIPQS